MMIESFVIGLMIGIILVGLIFYYFFVSSVSYVKNQTSILLQSGIDKIKNILKAIEKGYENISLPNPEFTYKSDNYSIHPFLLRLVMLSTNWALGTDIRSTLPSNLQIIDTVGKHALLYRYRDSLYLVFRGSLYSEDFENDIDFSQIYPDGYPEGSRVHQGFYKLWKPLQEKLQKIKSLYNPKKLYIVGYSLGSVLGLLSAKVFETADYPVHIYLYAIPRCGNYEFVNYVQTHYKNLEIILNATDLIPTIPTPVYSNLFGNTTYYYCDFTCAKRINVQTGDLVKNHTCGTYLKAFETDAPEAESIKTHWIESTIL